MSAIDETPSDPARCPVCAGPNLCAIAAGLVDESCWCAQIEFSPHALENVAPQDRSRRCICPKCAVQR